eukprot:TRINITY_DN21797_c1_g1_i1.p1 TRINITY_DN21797_c1_g1~~TRINITY_DN21797_c1_g1_i1.p1  ORF type:complete len:378 (+),score=56.60 TRINITY_DN21797_c1_g1_i1:171-1304(+)
MFVGSASRMASEPRTLSIKIGGGETRFVLGLFDGVEQSALSQAVFARAALLEGEDFFLTASQEGKELVVPLSAALPHDLPEVTLHRVALRKRTPFGGVLKVDDKLCSDANNITKPTSPNTSSASASTIAVTAASRGQGYPDGGCGFAHTSGETKIIQTVRNPQKGRDDNVEGLGCDNLSTVTSMPCLSKASETSRGRQSSFGDRACDPLLGRKDSFGSSFFRRRSFGPPRSASIGTEDGKTKDNAHVQEMVNSVERMNRLTTDMANERTLLAWTRTCFAAIRTVVAYLNIHVPRHTGGLLSVSILITELAMAALVMVLAWTGQKRFNSIKDAISLKVPPPSFGRLSVRYTNAIVLLASVVTALGICTQQLARYEALE